MHRVLNWGTSQEEPIATLEAKKSLPSHTRRVLDILSFIEDHILPFDALEVLLILRHLSGRVSEPESMERSVVHTSW